MDLPKALDCIPHDLRIAKLDYGNFRKFVLKRSEIKR